MTKITVKQWMLFLFISYLLAILLLTLLPMHKVEQVGEDFFGDFRIDYLVHVLLFLPWILFRCLFFKNGKLLWAILGICFAIATELMQYYLPYRSFNPYDMLFNVVGLLLGYLVFMGINLKIEEVIKAKEKEA
jgi:glycopeptide antibiotics resistance protein